MLYPWKLKIMAIGDSYELLEMALGSDVERLKLADLPKSLSN